MSCYHPGDRIEGIHGSSFTRHEDGYWYTDRVLALISDSTADWMLSWELRAPKTQIKQGGKISKTEKATTAPEWLYKWRLIRKEDHAQPV